MTQLTLQLPSAVLQNARKQGWLDGSVLTAILWDHLEYRKANPGLKHSSSNNAGSELEHQIRAEVTAVLNLNKQDG
ncbi:MAG: hypothetical protein OXE03_07880 [Gammaproteobacteria bacterium]|nr:hypothetical protein [Gammaproteobacteria bacterium]